jgi:hypothetical protein
MSVIPCSSRPLSAIRIGSQFLTNKLLLKVNEAKSAVARLEERKFLGFSISNDGCERRIAPKALDKFKAQIRAMTRRTRGLSLHDSLMARVAARVSDKRVLKLIRAFLNAGVMEDGLVRPVMTAFLFAVSRIWSLPRDLCLWLSHSLSGLLEA